MSKIGIALPGALSLVAGVGAYMPRSSYAPKREDTYTRADDIAAALGTKLWAGEAPRQPLDRITNLAQLFNFPQPPPPSAAGCVGVSQTFTSTGTFTSSCTGTLTMEVWGSGSTTGPNLPGAGGGAFAQSAISVTNGQTWLAEARPGNPTGGTYASFICPTAITACVSTLKVCSGTSLTSSNFVCADAGRISGGGGVGGAGGSTANSVGTTKFAGGKGGDDSSVGAGGGGAAGPNGAGAAGVSHSGTVGGTGGIGDNGSGGSGGAGATPSVPGVTGGSNVNGGGGGGGGNGFAQPGGYGGVPGGGGGGSYYGSVGGGRGEIRVHSDASDVLTPVVTGGSGHGGGTVSMT